MSITLQVLMLAVHVGLLYVMYKIYGELSRTRRILRAKYRARRPFSGPSSFRAPSVDKRVIIALAIWIWRHRQWELDEKSVPPGCVADHPPSFPGSYEGQRVKTECVRC